MLLALCASADASDLEYLGGYAALGSMLGVAGLATGDVDGDGHVEILVTGTTQYFNGSGWFTLIAADATAPSGYREVAFGEAYAAGLSAATLLDLRQDGRDEVLAGLTDGTVHAFAGTALTPAGNALVSGAVSQFALADPDGDGERDLVVLSANAITLLDPVTFAQRGSVPYGGAELAIGDVDGDGSDEVVLNTGYVLRLSRSGSDLVADVVWTYPSGSFGIHIGLADVDGDGLPELVAESDWDYLTVFDLDLESPKWQSSQLGDLDAMTLADVDGDGVPDAIVGSGQWGYETAIDLTTQQTLWSVPNPLAGTGHAMVSDVDGDGAPELLWTGGWDSTGSDALYVYAMSDLVEKFHTQDVTPPFDAVAVTPAVDGFEPRVAFASWKSESGYADGIVWQWNAMTLEPLTATAPDTFLSEAWTGLHALAYGNAYDAPDSLELLVGTDRLYDGAIYLTDAATGIVDEQRLYDSGSPINALVIDDLDGDGHDEIIVGNYGEHTGSPGVYVYLFDAATGAELWRSISLAGTFGAVTSVAVGDLDGDGVKDIAAIARENGVGERHLFQFTGAAHEQWESPNVDYSVAITYDLDGDGRAEVVAGTASGSVVVVDGSSHEEIASMVVGSGEVSAIQAFRAPGSAGTYVATVVDGQLRVHDLADGHLVAASPVSIGATHGLAVLADPADNSVRLFVGGEAAFRAYRYRADTIFADGFE